MSDPRSDAQISRDVAQQAGRLLLDIRRDFLAEHGQAKNKETANRLRDKADAASNELILDLLRKARRDDAILSEEAKDDPIRLQSARVWIVDPLDGTWEYGQDRADFAVHIALWAGDELCACTVDLPAQGLTRSVLDDVESPQLPTDRPVRIVASRSRPPATLEQVRSSLSRILKEAGVNRHGVEVVDVGSVGAKVNEILSGRADAYVHDTGFYEWDVAAPYGVAQHYGLRCSNTSGDGITFNHMPPYVHNLIVSHAQLYTHLMQALAEASTA
jgi:3'(2'), 5'-bisphosphate nucleotidase